MIRKSCPSSQWPKAQQVVESYLVSEGYLPDQQRVDVSPEGFTWMFHVGESLLFLNLKNTGMSFVVDLQLNEFVLGTGQEFQLPRDSEGLETLVSGLFKSANHSGVKKAS